jgi:putative SOS response-associated peptidase YedK
MAWLRIQLSEEQQYIVNAERDVAALWERWAEPGGEAVESFTILTTEANELMKRLHDRMPVILAPWDYDRWIDPKSRKVEDLQALLLPCPDEWLTATPVSTYVNSPKNEGPKCLEPVPS